MINNFPWYKLTTAKLTKKRYKKTNELAVFSYQLGVKVQSHFVDTILQSTGVDNFFCTFAPSKEVQLI